MQHEKAALVLGNKECQKEQEIHYIHELHDTCHSLTFYFTKKDSKRLGQGYGQGKLIQWGWGLVLDREVAGPTSGPWFNWYTVKRSSASTLVIFVKNYPILMIEKAIYM